MLLTVRSHEKLERRLPPGYLLRVLLNDRDVTNDCQSADNAQGWALLVERDARGFHYREGRDSRRARALHHGAVHFVVTDATGTCVLGTVDADGSFIFFTSAEDIRPAA
jgi:hypothetical protein